jgi:cell division initiation protein
METTPLDVRKQEFGRQFRGYNRTEVDTFLDMVATEMENLTLKRNQLEEELRHLSSRLEDYRNIEKTLQSTLLTSQKQAEEMIRNAEERAELLLRRAKVESERLYDRAYRELSALRAQIGELKGLKESFAARLRSLLDTHGRLLEEVMKEKLHPTDGLPPKRGLISEEEIERAVEEFKGRGGLDLPSRKPPDKAAEEKPETHQSKG